MASPTYYSEAVQRAGGVAAVLLQEDIDQQTAEAEMARFARIHRAGVKQWQTVTSSR